MSDLISKTEIISTFTELGKTGRYGGMCEWVIEIVKQLPPAELSTNLAEVGADCISRQQAIDALTEYGNGRAVFISVGEAVIRIEQLPPIQPTEPKRGKWIYHPEIGWGETWLCDQCGEKTTSTVMGKPRDNFCPNCGADMRGEHDG